MSGNKRWTAAEDDRLIEMIDVGCVSHTAAARKLGRSVEAVRRRMKILGDTVNAGPAPQPQPQPQPKNESLHEMWMKAMGRIS